MKLKAFRIQNFRSIVDSGFQDLSPDHITTIIGQNESGKTSLLEALCAFEEDNMTVDDLRIDGTVPIVTCVYQFDSIDEAKEITEDFDESAIIEFYDKLNNFNLCVSIKKTWDDESIQNAPHCEFENTDLITSLNEVFTQEEIKRLLEKIYENTPFMFAFEDAGLLPSTIDLIALEKKDTSVDGYKGATNFLELANLSIENLKNHQKNDRLITNKIDQANSKISDKLKEFWSQTLGIDDKISIQMEIKNYDATVPGKQGQPYLSFWIKDKNGRLRPKQRSKGVKWFISFFITLLTTALKEQNCILLIDEPGANLHAKAQKDILRILESVKDKLQIIYATHSPYLLDIEKIYRVLAVEREDADEYTVSNVYKFQKLGNASIDTLLPLYMNMGVDISHQDVVQKKENIILEEISAFFYFKAFWDLCNKRKSVYFLPATGVNNIPMLSNLMLGWGLEFSVVVDDDSAGRKVFNKLKSINVLEDNKLIKITDCDGVEDLFCQEDFKEFVLKNVEADFQSDESNSAYLKRIGNQSKPLLGRNFMIAVKNKEISRKDLSTTTMRNISLIVEKVFNSL